MPRSCISYNLFSTVVEPTWGFESRGPLKNINPREEMGNWFPYISLSEMIQPVFWCVLMESDRGCLRWSEASRNVVAVKAGEEASGQAAGSPGRKRGGITGRGRILGADRQTRLETYEVGSAPWTLKFFRPQFPNSCKIRLIPTVVETVKRHSTWFIQHGLLMCFMVSGA